MELTINGVIKRINAPTTSPKGFRKCEVHIEETEGDYPNVWKVDFVKDDVDEAASLAPGQKVSMKCDLTGREWKNNEGQIIVFTSIKMWKYEVIEESIKEQVMAKAAVKAAAKTEGKDDDLPF